MVFGENLYLQNDAGHGNERQKNRNNQSKPSVKSTQTLCSYGGSTDLNRCALREDGDTARTHDQMLSNPV